MATFTSLGIGSGLDINTMISKLVAVESQPLTQLQKTASSLQTQVSSIGKITSLMSGLQTAAEKLTNPSLWTQSTATSADAATVQVISDSGAATGSYGVSVQQLAATQTAVSGSAYADASQLVGAGTLTIDIGSWQGQQQPLSFVPQVGRANVSITVTSSDTLQSLADKINSADAGVSAAIVTDSSGARLSLRSTSSGADNGFRVTTSDGDGNNTDASGLSRFAFDPEGGAASMVQTLAGADAKATVNGIAVSSASNDLSGVVSGLTLRLHKLSTDAVDVSVTADTDSIKTAITGFVDAYNALSSNISDQTKYDAATKTAGNLQGDSTALALQRQLRSLIGSPSSASSTYSRLSDVGIAITRDGTLSVNSTKLSSALGNLTELKKAFAANGNGDATLDGFARRYDKLATQVLASDGSLTMRTDGLQQRITKNGLDQTAMQSRIDAYQQRLVSQYSALDSSMSSLNALQSYVTAQLAALTKSSSSS